MRRRWWYNGMYDHIRCGWSELADEGKDVNILKVKSENGQPLKLEQLVQVEGSRCESLLDLAKLASRS